ncbi:unnamed protein product [Closterium sp. NIES-65]|nr:unnamed protein product [Closterium sp. NIES-65]
MFLSHPHLVHLHGYCTKGDEALLVYDFMPGGSLDEALEDRGSLDSGWGAGAVEWGATGGAKEELFFSWSMRLKVAVQVAEALAYMHGRNFIHGNLKAASVLLSPVSACKGVGERGGNRADRRGSKPTALLLPEYDTKLAGFGKMRVGPETEQLPMELTRILGIWDDVDLVIDVHAGVCLLINLLINVHAGVCLLINLLINVHAGVCLLINLLINVHAELVTGRRVVDEGEKMVIECRRRLSDLTRKAAEYIDPHLGNQYPERGARGLATLARHCVADDRRTRPGIGTVLEKLKLLVRACESDEAEASAETAALERGGVRVSRKGRYGDAAAKAAALEAGESGSEGGHTEVTGGEEGPLVAVAPVVVVA